MKDTYASGILTLQLDLTYEIEEQFEGLRRAGIHWGGRDPFVYRGHARADWSLLPTLYRRDPWQAQGRHEGNFDVIAREQLAAFKWNLRGLRDGTSTSTATDDEVWALGQHHGLATPLLDWTESPYFALFFALADRMSSPTERCCIWALNTRALADRGIGTVANGDTAGTVQVIRPFVDDNHRLIRQRGLFTKAPPGKALEVLIAETLATAPREDTVLVKIEARSDYRHIILERLDQMGINHLSLFADAEGAALHTNVSMLGRT